MSETHRTEPVRLEPGQIEALIADLERRVDGEIRFDAGTRALYTTDASNYRQVPIGVVLPRSREALVETVAICRQHGAPLLPRVGGTSLAGQSCNVAVIIDCSKYLNHVIEIDARHRLARVEPGCIFDDMRHAAEERGLTAGFDTSTHDRATVGGMLGNNSCGVHSVLAAMEAPGSGRAADSTRSIDILTYDGLELKVGPTSEPELASIIRAGGRRGEIYARLKELRDRYADEIRDRYPDIPRRVSGYNLTQLLPENGFNIARALVDTEGTCVTILQAEVELVPNPPARALLVIGYPNIYATGDHAAEVMALRPVGCEALDGRLIENMRRKKLHDDLIGMLPEGGGWLLAEFGGSSPAEAQNAAEKAKAAIEASRKGSVTGLRLYGDPEDQERIWTIRESGLGATADVPGRHDNWPGWEDSSVPPERVGDYLRDLRKLFDRYGYAAALYGHFGQGCIHCRVDFDLRSEDGVRKWRAFLDDAADLVAGYGGSFSGEHGDGQARAALLERLYGPRIIEAFREFKAIWDPHGRMNPGKVVDPYPPETHLRIGPQFQPRQVQTTFRYPEDDGDFVHAMKRCVGVGKCRHLSGGVMCPSFMATREERHSTRGRARSLFEMLRHGPIEEGWRSADVREALDLCLACKGCKSDCPVNVDMATYKAEFMSHFYAGRLRPRAFYAMGLIPWWARLAAYLPGLANAATHAPGLSAIAKAMGGFTDELSIPRFAPQTFKAWFHARQHKDGAGREVVLFADTFTNHFEPEIGRAAVGLLEGAGYRVHVPKRFLCCGRPLYDKGFLGLARSLLRTLMDELGPAAQRGLPIVGLEPACLSAFKDELVNLFPDDPRAGALRDRARLLEEFLDDEGWKPAKLGGRALLHFHCHQHAVLSKAPTRSLLEAAGLEIEAPDSGCCGMAGSFGFEAEHHEVARKCGERVLLPAVRQSASETRIVATGFSCRQQITQCTGRQALHPAQILRPSADFIH